MPYKVGFNEHDLLVEIIYLGRLTAQELRDSTCEAFELANEHNTNRYLVDLVEADLSVSLMAIYDLPNHQYSELHVDRNSRIAVVRPRSERALEVAHFYETACLNSGWQAHVFATRQEALDWLFV
jgi:hypothetical protein